MTTYNCRHFPNMYYTAKEKAFCVRLYFTSNSYSFVRSMFCSLTFFCGVIWREKFMKTVPKLSRNWKHQSSGKPEESPENRSETWLTTSSDASKSASRGEGLIWSMFFKLLKKQWKNLHNDLKFCANIMQSLNLMLKKNAIVYVVFSPFYYCLNGSKTFLTTRYLLINWLRNILLILKDNKIKSKFF